MRRRIRRIEWFFLLLCARALPGLEIGVPEYAQELRRLKTEIENADGDAVRERVRRLQEVRVRSGTQTFLVDRSIIGPLANRESGRDALKTGGVSGDPHAGNRPPRSEVAAQTVGRIDLLLAELGRMEPSGAPPTPTDIELFTRIREQHREEAMASGGDVGKADFDQLPEIPFWERIWRGLSKAASWVGKKLEKILEGLIDMLFSWNKGKGSWDLFGPFTIIGVLLFAGILALFTLDLIRKYRRPGPGDAPAPAPTRAVDHDADPVSRDMNEWERYARELACHGRYREGIRAWYHAALVALFRNGWLHYRKGRTNWEYCYALPVEADWRTGFIDMTHLFEREWYGRSESTQEELEACAVAARTIMDRACRQGGSL